MGQQCSAARRTDIVYPVPKEAKPPRLPIDWRQQRRYDGGLDRVFMREFGYQRRK